MEIIVKNGDSLEKAIDKANSCDGPVWVKIQKGNYEVHKTLEIKHGCISVEGQQGTNIYGSKRISLEGMPADGNIVTVDLKKCGITDTGKFGEGPFEDFWKVYDIPKPHMTEYGPGAELFYEDRIMPVSRYPEEGFMKIKKALGKSPIFFKKEKNGSEEGIFTSDDDSVKSWEDYKNILLVGYWNVDWATQRHTIKEIDRESGAITVNEPYHVFGYRDGACYTEKTGGHFYAVNVRSAVKKPGQWCIDRENALVYIYPYEGQKYFDISLADDVFYANGQRDISVSGLNISQCRKSGICFENCEDVRVDDIEVKNVGAWGILGENCTKMSVENCRVSGTGGGGIAVGGGCRDALSPSGNLIKKCTVHGIARWHRTYMAALDISGVGCTVSENYIYDVPHFGIVFAGNNHVIEKNEISNACYESNDAGAIYSGRNWTFRGNIIRYNYLHDLRGHENKGCAGVYFDDLMSSAEVYGNIFANIPYIALLLGGGRDFDIYDNTFYNCKMAVMYDKRGVMWASYSNDGGRLGERLKEVDYKSDTWKNAYPKLYTIKENDMLMPMGNKIRNNTIIGGDGFALQTADLSDITQIEGNTFVHSDAEKHEINHVDWFYIDE